MMFNATEVILTAVIGSGGMLGIFFFILRYYLEKRLKEREEYEKEQTKQRMERIKINDRLTHCYGRMFFWMYKAIVDNKHNGDLENAFKELQAAEDEKKELDRKILAEHMHD